MTAQLQNFLPTYPQKIQSLQFVAANSIGKNSFMCYSRTCFEPSLIFTMEIGRITRVAA